jgi:hypothetical protein
MSLGMLNLIVRKYERHNHSAELLNFFNFVLGCRLEHCHKYHLAGPKAHQMAANELIRRFIPLTLVNP